MVSSFNCIERPLSRLFYRYGRFVSLHPLPFIAVPLLITAISSIGFLDLRPLTDAIYLFTPKTAPSKMERQIIHNNWPLHNKNYIPGRAVTQVRESQVIVVAKDGGNILERPYSDAVRELDLYIQQQITVNYNGTTYNYSQLCLEWHSSGCPGNKHIHIISDLYNHGLNITYPTTRFGSSSGYVGSALGGVKLTYGPNDTIYLVSAKAWFMIYHLKFYPNSVSYISGLWEQSFQEHLQRYPPNPYISVTYFHSQTLAEELERNADSLIPRFVVAFTILVLFSVLCSITFIDGTLYVDWTLSKPVLSFLGVLNAGMGIITGIGITNFLGMPFNDIVGVMPFLLVAVGTDNMFLMVAAVRKTNRAYPVHRRIGECMSDAAISILITALTDALSFGVGTITSIPAVQIFCVYTCVAISVTFFYQITFFCALLSLATEWEAAGLHCIWLRPTVPESLTASTSIWNRLFRLGSRAVPNALDVKKNLREPAASYFFRNWFAPVLMHPVIHGLVIFWILVYWGISVYGCLQLREGLEPVNLLVSDSYAIPHYRNLEKYFWQYGFPLQVVVNNAPDLRNPEERLRIKKMVHTFATTNHSIGDEGVQFWLNEMELYYENEVGMNIIDSAFYGMVEHFISAHSHDIWSEDILWERDKNNETRIKSFRFLIGMKNIVKTHQQQDATFLFREVASWYPTYNVTTFCPLWLFTDQYAIIAPNTIQNIVIALIVMIVIAVILIPQPLCSLWVAVSIASIDLGVIGFMTLWEVNLDAISMITIIMSIGFSVDYTAHITYGYVISDEVDPRKRVCMALGALGWPLTQGACSTILAVVVLADTPAYMITTFFKTVFLSITLGLLHGLVFLPVMLSLFVRGCCILGAQEESKERTTKKRMISSVVSPNDSNVNEDDDVQPYGRYSIYLSRVSSLDNTQSNTAEKSILPPVPKQSSHTIHYPL
ncbi:hypothetical protein AB6A40_002241 [Gnathostoma spinigerum]|uniref:SSD domain-containing protein n=1 Tax=Gnathostoma spinigerum TaxID=75299 RepID=A0ABD6EG58_9BILA